MQIITGDFETFYSSEFSLSKLSEVEYILDPRFQTIMCAIKVDQEPSEIHVGHAAVADRFAQIDWGNAAFLSHNMRFDGSILAWHFGHVPKLYLDTLSLARAMTHAHIGRSSLKAVSDYLGLPPKGDEVVRAMGKRLEDFTPEELSAYGDYCLRDNDNCRMIFDRMISKFPKSELLVIDLMLRMFILPSLRLEPNILAENLQAVRAEKEAMFGRLAHIDRSVFSSQKKFAELLESYSVDVPMKTSPTTGELIPAVAKNDRAFKELCEDDTLSAEVQAALAIRVGAKSTIEESRTQRMLDLALREWGDDRGLLAVPLKYYGAHTGRASGDSGINMQNIRRKSLIKKAIHAPPGYRVLHRDASQVEARMTAYVAGCTELLEGFRKGEDVYSIFATDVYGRAITKANEGERFVGKTSILGLGYGMGGPRFRHTLFIGQGGVSVTIDEEEAKRIVRRYRTRYSEIPMLWAAAESWLAYMINPSEAFAVISPGMLIDIDKHAVWLPNGCCIAYKNLRRYKEIRPNGQSNWTFCYDDPYGAPKKLFGGKVVENVVQAVCHIIINNIAARVLKETRIHPALERHDALDYCVPGSEVEQWDRYLEQQFAIVPSWAPGLPLASEGGWGRTLAEAEAHLNV